MRIIFLILIFIGQSAYCREGFFRPSLSVLTPATNQMRFSVVSIGYGSGVVIGANTILTAAHVVAGCPCPTGKAPIQCKIAFKAPKYIDSNGVVVSWKAGETTAKLACGLNSGVENMKLFIDGVSQYSAYPAGKSDPFFPKEEIAILEFDNQLLNIPSVSVRQTPVNGSEELTLFGYPGASVRARENKTIRQDSMKMSLKYLYELRQILDSGKFSSVFAKFETQVLSMIDEVGNKMDSLPNDSVDKKVLMFGTMSYVLYPQGLMRLWKEKLADKACARWSLDNDSCYSMIFKDQIDEAIKSASITLAEIQNENSMDYPEADQTLRVSFGKPITYQLTRNGFSGLLQTDVDGVSGYSGGPLFDDHGLLVGITSTGPWGASIAYKPNEGVNVVSHFAIQDLINQTAH